MSRLKRCIAGSVAAVLLIVSFMPCIGSVNAEAKDNYDQTKQAAAVSQEEAVQKEYEWLTFEQIKGGNSDAEHMATMEADLTQLIISSW